jgi:hypothetical protein
MITFFDAQDVVDILGLQHLDVRGIGTETIFGDNHLEMRVVLTELGENTFGRGALAIIFAGAVLFDNGLGHQRNDFALIGMNESRPQHLMGIGHGAVSLLFL